QYPVWFHPGPDPCTHFQSFSRFHLKIYLAEYIIAGTSCIGSSWTADTIINLPDFFFLCLWKGVQPSFPELFPGYLLEFCDSPHIFLLTHGLFKVLFLSDIC